MGLDQGALASNPHKSTVVQSHCLSEQDSATYGALKVLRDCKNTFGKEQLRRQHGKLASLSHPLLQQILLVQFQGVEINGEAAGVLHHHLCLVSDGIRQEGPKLQDRRVELQAWLQTLPSDMQVQLLSALQNTQDERMAIDFLNKHKAETQRDGVTTKGKQRQKGPRVISPGVLRT